jgi:hypothetical protein
MRDPILWIFMIVHFMIMFILIFIVLLGFLVGYFFLLIIPRRARVTKTARHQVSG